MYSSPSAISTWSVDSKDAKTIPDSKAHGANMGPIWGQQDPGGPNVGSTNFAYWDVSCVGH